MTADYTVIPPAPPTPAEVEAVIRARVAALPRGVTFVDHLWISPGLLIAERTLLYALGCSVSEDPLPAEPFTREARKQFLRPTGGEAEDSSV